MNVPQIGQDLSRFRIVPDELGDQGFRSINIADTLVALLTFRWSINIALVCVYMYRQFIIDMSIAIVDVYFVSARVI